MDLLGSFGLGLVVAVYGFAFVSKVISPPAWVRLRGDVLQILPIGSTAAALVVSCLLLAEAGTLLGLIIPALRVVGVALSFALAAGVFVIILRGQVVSCNCFGKTRTALSVRHLVRNLLLGVFAVMSLFAPSGFS
jgi:hypothetical protein